MTRGGTQKKKREMRNGNPRKEKIRRTGELEGKKKRGEENHQV